MELLKNINHKIIPKILKPIILDFKILSDLKVDLSKEIEKAFGVNGNGILLINNIPNFIEYKNQLLPLAKKIHLFPPEIKKKYERPEVNYSVGICTFEKYHFNGVYDMATSWYCSSLKDKIQKINYVGDSQEVQETYIDNFWPTEEIPELEPAFKNMGKLTSVVGFEIGKHIEKFIKNNAPTYELGKINRAIANPVGRLIHYHTSREFTQINKEEAVYWHSDTSSITALCSPIYMNEKNEVVPNLSDEPGHGLEILRRDGSQNSCCIPSDCLAIQIGEIMQIFSGGKLEATPHRVIATKYPDYTRQTFVNFFLPEWDEIISVPDGFTEEDVFKVQSDKVPDLKLRWKNGISFKELIDNSWNFFK
jgi:isopenicillin N synthase-like dioxygenase